MCSVFEGVIEIWVVVILFSFGCFGVVRIVFGMVDGVIG